MFNWILVGVGFVFLGYSSWLDWKTREVDDKITHSFVGLAVGLQLARALAGWGSWSEFGFAIGIGALFFAVGWLMYRTGQWGGADVKILAGLGIMFANFPEVGGFEVGFEIGFPFSYFINIFLVAFAYSIVWSLGLAVREKKVRGEFVKVVGKDLRELGLVLALIVAAFVLSVGFFVYRFGLGAGEAVGFMGPLGYLFLVIPGFWFLIKFVKVVEEECFRLDVKAGKLREFDLLIEDVLVEKGNFLRVKPDKERRKRAERVVYDSADPNGLRPAEIEEIRTLVKGGKIVDGFVMKWGLPFVPVFLIALPITVWVGNLLFWIAGY